MTQSLIITLPKKDNLQLCQNYRTISLISHPSKVMLRILLNRPRPQTEEIIKEEQAGFRAGTVSSACNTSKTSTTSSWTSRRRFDRVWHTALLATMSLYHINSNLIRTTQCLYDKATSPVYYDNSTGEWFRTTIGVH